MAETEDDGERPAVSKFCIRCHECNQSAIVIELHKQASERFSIVTKGFIGRVTTFAMGQGPVTEQLFDKIKVLAETNLVALHSDDPDMFGFVCRQCGYAYCINCWKSIHNTFDGEFFDATRGQCPHGHEQMLQD